MNKAKKKKKLNNLNLKLKKNHNLIRKNLRRKNLRRKNLKKKIRLVWCTVEMAKFIMHMFQKAK